MKRLLAWIVVLAVIGGGVYWIYDRTTPATTQAAGGGGGRRGGGAGGQPTPVLVTPAATKNVPIYLAALGTVQAYNSVTVVPMITGPLNQVLFTEGQMVKAGDVLARIDPRPYQATLDADIAKKAQDEATLANAKLDLARYQKLVTTNYTSAQTADTARATVAADEAIVKQDQANIDAARTQLSYTTIAAPIAGRTGIRQVDQGNIISSGSSTGLVVISQMQPISVVFTLPQQTLADVQAALAANNAPVQALPQGSLGASDTEMQDAGAGPGLSNQDAAVAPAAGTLAAAGASGAAKPQILDRGVVAVLDNTVDSSTGTIKLKATFPNAKLQLWPGGFVNIRLRTKVLQNVLTVPQEAVQRGPNGAYVYVIGADDKAARRVVTVGHEDAQGSVIESGLQTGERVVVDGASRLSDGARVVVQQPAAAANGPAAGAAKPAAGTTPGATPGAAPGTGERRQRREGAPAQERQQGSGG